MKGTITAIIALLSFSQCEHAEATDNRINFLYLNAESETFNSSLSSKCEGTQDDPSVFCSFDQLTISQSMDPSKIENETNTATDKFNARWAKNEKETVAKMCGDTPISSNELDVLTKETSNPFEKKTIELMAIACSSKKKNDFVEVLKNELRGKTATCKIYQNEFGPIKFSKVSKNKWVANTGPEGICDVTILYEMSNSIEHPDLWEFSQTRTFANKAEELCQWMNVGIKSTFTWKAGAKPLKCEVVNFGY